MLLLLRRQMMSEEAVRVTCCPASDGAHLGDVHDGLVSPHIRQAAQVGVLEGLLGVGQGLHPLRLGWGVVLLQHFGQILTLLPRHLHQTRSLTAVV